MSYPFTTHQGEHVFAVDGKPAAFLVMYPSGGFCQSFPPGKESEVRAHDHARQLGGYVLALPMLADYTRGPRD